MAGKSVFGTAPASEQGEADHFVGWSEQGRWQQLGPMTRARAVAQAAEVVRRGLAPFFYAPRLGDSWHPVPKLFPTE